MVWVDETLAILLTWTVPLGGWGVAVGGRQRLHAGVVANNLHLPTLVMVYLWMGSWSGGVWDFGLTGALHNVINIASLLF